MARLTGSIVSEDEAFRAELSGLLRSGSTPVGEALQQFTRAVVALAIGDHELQGPARRQLLAQHAGAVEAAALAGGSNTIVISLTTLLLIVIIVILLAR